METQIPTAPRAPKKTMSPSDLVLFPIPVLAVKGAICINCMQPPAAGEKMDRCKGCKRVSYCSFECQKQDWKKAHKNVCPVLKEINKLDAPCGPRSWEEYRADMWKRVDAFRVHPKQLKINDERILQYQPHCASCHRNIFQLSTDTNKLTLCSSCNLAHHCPSCTPTTHFQHCNLYTQVATAERFAISHFLESLEPNVTLFTRAPRAEYLALSQAESWRDYYTEISDHGAHLAPLLTPDLEPVNLPRNPEITAKQISMSGALKAGTEKLSMMLTILAAIEATRPSINNFTTLSLHLIGATAKELDALMLFEELLHLLPNVQNLNCIFIGPNMPRPENSSGERIYLDTCPLCQTKNRTRSMVMFKGTYAEYMRSLDVYRGPDLAVLFHTGHSQDDVDSWAPTIRFLAHAKFPSVFTCYNEKEMQEETAGFKALGARFVVDGTRNRWASLRPLLEVMEDREGTVYYNNMYWYVIAHERPDTEAEKQLKRMGLM